MAVFVSRVTVAAPPEDVFALLTDWPAHGRWVPLTTVTVLTANARGVGARFVGRSALPGPLARIGFDDPMDVVAWQEPGPGTDGVCTVVKTGRVRLGRATLRVMERPGGSEVTWTEDVQLAPVRLTRPLGPLLSLVGKQGFDRALGAMKRELEAR